MHQSPNVTKLFCLLIRAVLSGRRFLRWVHLAVLPDSRPRRGPVGAVNIPRPRPRQRSMQPASIGAFDGDGSVRLPSRQRRLGATLDVVDASSCYDLRDLVVQ